MSENIPESIPTSSDRRSHRAVKKRVLGPTSQQSAQVDALFANPDREINLSSTPIARTLAPPPEIVANVQGSSAGAGSGEFHVYKASRRRENARLRLMDEEMEREERDKEFKERREELRSKDEGKLSRNQAKRAKMKARKSKAETLRKMGKDTVGEGGERNGGAHDMTVPIVKRKLGPAKIANTETKGNDESITADDQAEHGGLDVGDAGVTIHDDD